MKKIFVTGGAGFIASNLIMRLLKLNYKVISIDNFDSFYDRRIKEKNLGLFAENKSFSFFEGDILNKDLLNEIFEEHKPDAVVHLAAKAGVRPSLNDPIGYYKVNMDGTINILETMKKFGVSKLVFASSSSVYGENKKVPFSESDIVDFPISPYAASKKAGELICYSYHHLYSFDIFCMRFFTVYGYAQRPEMAIANFASKIINNTPITVFDKNGVTSRDYTFIDDIVSGLVNSIERVKGYEILNLGNSRPIHLPYLIELLERYLDKKAIIEYKERQMGDVLTTYADIKKAEQLLDYNPDTPIELGIKKYCDWLLSEKVHLI